MISGVILLGPRPENGCTTGAASSFIAKLLSMFT